MPLLKEHKRVLLIENGVISAMFNFFINGLIAWLIFRSLVHIPLWGQPSVAADILATAFMLPFITCIIVSSIVSSQTQAGKIPRLTAEQYPASEWFLRSSLFKAVCLGLMCVVFTAIPIVWILELGQAQVFTTSSFILFKAVWGALLALTVSPLIAWWALAKASYENKY